MNASSASGLWPIFTVRMGVRSLFGGSLVGGEAPPELAGADRPDDGVAVTPGIDLDPRLAEVNRAMCVVGRDLHERDRGGLVQRIASARLGHLDRVEGDAAGADAPDALQRLLDREVVAGWMIEDVERLAVTDDLADVLIEPRPVQLDAVEQDQLRRRDLGDLAPVAVVDPALVVGDGEEVVAEILVGGDELRRLLDAVREGGVGVKVTPEPGHQVRASGPRDAARAAGRPR